MTPPDDNAGQPDRVSPARGQGGSDRAARPAPAEARRKPHNLEAERAVLGSMMLDREIIPQVSSLVEQEDFYAPAHGIIYGHLLKLEDDNKTADLTLLTERLGAGGELEGVGGYMYLAGLVNAVDYTGNAPDYAKVVRDKAVLRRLIAAAERIASECQDESLAITSHVETAERLIFEVSQKEHEGRFISLAEISSEVLGEIMRLYETKDTATGQKTHYDSLDRVLGGFERSALAILAARPSIGKTAFALNIVHNIIRREERAVGFFSLEMGADQLMHRLIAIESQIPGMRIRQGRLTPAQLELVQESTGILAELPLFIDDTPGLTIMQLRSRARRLKKQRPDLALLVVDYLQLMYAPGDQRREQSRQQEVASISRGLKELAKELSVPVFALSQLSRNVEQRSGKTGSAKPVLSDLRESGSIEQDADVVMFVHRERLETQKDAQGRPIDGAQVIPTEIIVAKNRNGPIKTVDFVFLPDSNRFGIADESSMRRQQG